MANIFLNMKFEDKRTLVISIIMISFLGFLSYRNMSKIKSIEVVKRFPDIEVPEIELPSFDSLTSGDVESFLREQGVDMPQIKDPEVIEYSKHSIDNAIGFEYPSHWTITKADIARDYRDSIDVPFIAQSKNISRPTIIVISKINAQDNKEVMDIMNNIFRKEEMAMEIMEETEDDSGVYLEVRYTYSDGQIAKSKEKIVKVNDDFYLVSVIAYAENFVDQLDQINHIINSVYKIDDV